MMLKKHIFTIIFSLMYLVPPLSAQDSLHRAVTDSVPSPSSNSELTAPIHYKADSIQFSVHKKLTILSGNAVITYGDMKLTAAKVLIDWDKSLLNAYAIPDSLDSLGNMIYKGIPKFEEKGTDPMEGYHMTYNFRTKRGRVWEGTTEMDPGYYRGENINKIGEKTFLIEDGYFTSCSNIRHPHYYFHAKKMWMEANKKLVARPIKLYIADIPILYFPMVYMSLRRERRSGIILPKYGDSQQSGRYLKDFGFYWAMNDYMDATFRSSYYDRRGFIFSGDMRYIKRYALGGSFHIDYTPKDINTGDRRERYRIKFNHRHQVTPTLTITGNGTFQSDKSFNQDSYSDLDTRLEQNITSNISLSKRIPSLNSTLNLSFYRSENLQTGNITRNFPRLSFSLPSRQIGGKGKHWYGNITYTYSTNLTSNYTKKLTTIDSTETFEEETREGWKHQISVRSSQKIFKYFSISPNVNFTDLWVNEVRDYYWVDSLNDAQYTTRKGFHARHTFNAGVSAKTTIYGLFEIPIGPMKLIRHKLTPSISYSWSPDFSESKWDYVQKFVDSTGRTVQKDRYSNNPYGGTPASTSQRITYSIGNLFQGKLVRDDEEKKMDLFSLNTSGSYNMLADSLNWSNLSTTVQTYMKIIRLSGRMSHSFYETRQDGTGNRNEFYGRNHRFPLRLISTSADVGFDLSSTMFSRSEKKDEKVQKQDDKNGLNEFTIEDVSDFRRQEKSIDRLRNASSSWQANFSLNYSYNKSNIYKPVKAFNLRTNLTLQLTKNWKVLYRGNFDLQKKDISYQEFTVLRDLHCWEMYFRWQPSQTYGYFEFRINVKASALKDLKLTKRGSNRIY